MATNFTYQGIPGYGTNPNSFTELDQNRANYWNGGKQKDQLQLNQLYNDKFNMLNQHEIQRKNNELMLANNRKQLSSGIHSGVKQLMGGDNVSSWLKSGKPKSTWQDPMQTQGGKFGFQNKKHLKPLKCSRCIKQ